MYICVLLWQLRRFRHFRAAVTSQTIFLFWDHPECYRRLKEVIQLAAAAVAALEALKEKDRSKEVCICDCNDVLSFKFRI